MFYPIHCAITQYEHFNKRFFNNTIFASQSIIIIIIIMLCNSIKKKSKSSHTSISLFSIIQLFHGYLGNSRNNCFITKYILISMLHVIRIPLDSLELFPQPYSPRDDSFDCSQNSIETIVLLPNTY